MLNWQKQIASHEFPISADIRLKSDAAVHELMVDMSC